MSTPPISAPTIALSAGSIGLVAAAPPVAVAVAVIVVAAGIFAWLAKD